MLEAVSAVCQIPVAIGPTTGTNDTPILPTVFHASASPVRSAFSSSPVTIDLASS